MRKCWLPIFLVWYTLCVEHDTPQLADIRGAQLQRLRLLESIVYWEGLVRRHRLSEAFGLNVEGVSRDFSLYRELFPENLAYDPSRKGYAPTSRFMPKLADGSADEYLSMLRLHSEGSTQWLIQGLPGTAETERVPLQPGGINSGDLKEITRAIAAGTSLTGIYQSMRAPKPERVHVWPRALVFSGYRWHLRAYDLDREIHRDLVLARLSAKPGTARVRDIPKDQAWDAIVTVQVRPAEHWSPTQKSAIAKEYGMTRLRGTWVWSVKLRQCLAPYFLYLHRLDRLGKHQRVELVDSDLAKAYAFCDD